MAKILCIQASSRKKGYTAKLLNSAVEGIKTVDNVTVDLVQLFDYLPMSPCRSCWSCVKQHSCILDDSMGKNGELFQKISTANALLIAHPVYYGRPTGGINLLFERFYPFMWSQALNGMPFASISQAANNGGARNAQIDMTRWAVTFNLRVIGGLPVHMVTFEESLTRSEDLGKQLALEALGDVKERCRVTPVERYLVSYEGQWSRLESSLMDLTNGSMRYEDSLIEYALSHGSIKNEKSIELLHSAGEELRHGLACYAENDLRGAAMHMVKMSSYWSPATLNEFLADDLGI